MNNKKLRINFIASFVLTTMVLELVLPVRSAALTSGPVQPEIQSFEPVGTTDMVDPFTGDFVYNIPLLDVEGYPVNISYHSGINMEQEASWVGLGWNINPGAVNRAVRGLPDDFDGDSIQKTISILPERTVKVGMGLGAEVFGSGSPLISLSANLGGVVTMNNYRGVSVDFYTSAGVNTSFQMVSAGLNVGASVGSQSGASVNYGANAGLGINKSLNGDMGASGSFNLNTGGNYSPRTGLRRDAGFNVAMGFTAYGNRSSFSTGTSVPIGLQNHTAAVTNASYMNTVSGRLKIGGEIYGIYINGNANGSRTVVKFDENGSRRGYGYFHLNNSNDSDLLDFAREKDGMFNTTMHYLPQTHLTYDVYSVSGQGTGGSFRPFRNDMGSVFDPVTKTTQHNESIELEGGIGGTAEFGGEYHTSNTEIESGPWQDYRRPFYSDTVGHYEDYYFKEAGELTTNNSAFLSGIGNKEAATPESLNNTPLIKDGSNQRRVVRANHISALTAKAKDLLAYVDNAAIKSYKDSLGFKNYPIVTTESVERVSNSTTKRLGRKAHYLNEIVQTQKDGRRYVYGLPVVNNVQKESTFAVAGTGADKNNALTGYVVKDDSKDNTNGTDHFYSSTVTPTYVTAHLLTQVLSADYTDVTGNGVSDDDAGSYTKFNYTRKSADYRWRAPIEENKAQYNIGYYSDKNDDKASYMIGSREQWMLHSIETKNYVAEFYVTRRDDGRGVKSAILTDKEKTYYEDPYKSALSEKGYSYKLDSIALYNKHDRFKNGANASAIKTVVFTYDYSLCKNVFNNNYYNVSADYFKSGKLTLTGIYTRFGKSNISMQSPYKFYYSEFNPDYDAASKDKWGNYKPNTDPQLSNFEFPFTDQTYLADMYASAWSMTRVQLPSGGQIEVTYEADDFAYVQNKEAMSMFRLAGIGNSTTYKSSGQLYFSENQPNLYLYFTRDPNENNLLSVKENYLKGTNLLYFNIPVELKPGEYEPIKGYATVEAIDGCPGDPAHGYIKLAPKFLEGSSSPANPIVYTALNLGRYSLPHVLFPGADPGQSSVSNVAAGLKGSISELIQLHKNPLKVMMNQGKAKYSEYGRGFVRLTAPGLKKKGGGQRVKKIEFFDKWNQMAGGNAVAASYGKTYDYTIRREDGKGYISSGVASYEPMTGGDEMPQRAPVNYTVQEGTNFPPNDPVELYQEDPLGESFFPAPVVGYSRVTVRSIHQSQAKSAQGEDVYGFYTSKDFPVKVTATPLSSKKKSKFGIKGVEIEQEATQGFSIVLNDMHGKPSSTEHWVNKPLNNSKELINFQKFKYKSSGGELSNAAPVYVEGGAGMTRTSQELGRETDITIDTRMRKERSKSLQLSGNVNGFLIVAVPIIVPLIYPWTIDNKSSFKMATATKITQQYGIIDEIVSSNEGAVTNVRNEVFDPNTGSAVVTSVNNEFGDREYSAQLPAYWAYKNFGPSYLNHGMCGKFPQIKIGADQFSAFPVGFHNYNSDNGATFLQNYNFAAADWTATVEVGQGMFNFNVGDELLLWPEPGEQPMKVWVLGYFSFPPPYGDGCQLVIGPRILRQAGSEGWKGMSGLKTGVAYQVVRSGNRNQLTETAQNFVTINSANLFPSLTGNLTNLISLQAQTSNYSNTAKSVEAESSNYLNPIVSGKMHAFRPEKQVINLKARDYSTSTARNSGLYAGAGFFGHVSVPYDGDACSDQNVNSRITGGPYASISNLPTDRWISNQSVTLTSRNGQELENYETGIGYNSAVYGYQDQLPVMVAKNARYTEALFESFEDVTNISVNNLPADIANYLKTVYSPFEKLITSFTALNSEYRQPDLVYSHYAVSKAAAHTGYHSLEVKIDYILPLKVAGGTGATGEGRYSYNVRKNQNHIINLWLKSSSTSPSITNNSYNVGIIAAKAGGGGLQHLTPKTGIIDGWQQFEVVFKMDNSVTASLLLPAGYYYDDVRIFPEYANSKGFVYHPVTRKLMATLDENNYATFFEYDEEGNLIRTKKETERGILTLTESRRSHPKNQ